MFVGKKSRLRYRPMAFVITQKKYYDMESASTAFSFKIRRSLRGATIKVSKVSKIKDATVSYTTMIIGWEKAWRCRLDYMEERSSFYATSLLQAISSTSPNFLLTFIHRHLRNCDFLYLAWQSDGLHIWIVSKAFSWKISINAEKLNMIRIRALERYFEK